MAEKDKKQFPSLQQLIQDSWELFQKTATGYLKLFGLTMAALFGGAFIGFLIAIMFGLSALTGYFQGAHHMAPFPIATAIALLIWFILVVILIIVMGISFSIVNVFILHEKKTSPIFDLIKKSKRYILPYFITALLSAFITVGGMFIFFVPGLLFGVFFLFMLYEVVLEKQSGRQALARSYIMVKNHFWEVVLRLFVLEIANLIISSLFTHLAGANFGLRIVQFLYIVFSVWYVRAYLYVLYTQVRSRTTFSQHISLRWIWIVSLIGWVFAVFIFVGVGYGISHFHNMHPVRPMHRMRPGTV